MNYCFFLTTTVSDFNSESNGENSRNEKSLGVFLAPNKTQNIKQALEEQIFPSVITSTTFAFGSVLVFEIIGYALGGKDHSRVLHIQLYSDQTTP